MNATCTVAAILFLVGGVWLVIQWAGAREGVEIPGIGFVDLGDLDDDES